MGEHSWPGVDAPPALDKGVAPGPGPGPGPDSHSDVDVPLDPPPPPLTPPPLTPPPLTPPPSPHPRAVAIVRAPDVPARPPSIGAPGRAFLEVEPLLRVDPGHPPDTVFDHGRLEGTEVRAASVRGLSHRQHGLPRQDAYGLATDPDRRWLVAVVADGVSAGELSHEAAAFVARRGPREVVQQIMAGIHPADLDWYGVFRSLAGAILDQGQRSLQRLAPVRYASHPPDTADVAAAMATTVTFLVCATGACAGRDVVVAWLGDSPAWALDNQGGWTVLSSVKGAGQDVGDSRTEALPHIPRSAQELAVARYTRDEQDVLLLMTDGVGDPLGDGRGAVADHLARWWRRPPDAHTFATQVGFGRKSYDDDRTVVGIWEHDGGAPA